MTFWKSVQKICSNLEESTGILVYFLIRVALLFLLHFYFILAHTNTACTNIQFRMKTYAFCVIQAIDIFIQMTIICLKANEKSQSLWIDVFGATIINSWILCCYYIWKYNKEIKRTDLEDKNNKKTLRISSKKQKGEKPDSFSVFVLVGSIKSDVTLRSLKEYR